MGSPWGHVRGRRRPRLSESFRRAGRRAQCRPWTGTPGLTSRLYPVGLSLGLSTRSPPRAQPKRNLTCRVTEVLYTRGRCKAITTCSLLYELPPREPVRETAGALRRGLWLREVGVRGRAPQR